VLLDGHRRLDRRQQGGRHRAALCADAETAAGARRWNDANVLALSLRTTSQALLEEIVDAWFAAQPSGEADDVANIRHVDELR
jgi:ribose 5-phosphate isomerase B